MDVATERRMQQMVKQSALTTVEAHRLLDYFPETGDFRWRISRGRVSAGSIAGRIDHHGYRIISINGRKHKAARLAWLLMTGDWPPVVVDHEDRDKSNDRWSNLRLASNSENAQNREVQENNTSGKAGVRPTPHGTFQARIKKGGVARSIGTYGTIEEATEKRIEAEIQEHKEFSPNYETLERNYEERERVYD